MTAATTPDPRLLFFAGSARENSFNKRVARLGAMIAEANSIPSTFADLADYPMPIYNGDLEAASRPVTRRFADCFLNFYDGRMVHGSP